MIGTRQHDEGLLARARCLCSQDAPAGSTTLSSRPWMMSVGIVIAGTSGLTVSISSSALTAAFTLNVRNRSVPDAQRLISGSRTAGGRRGKFGISLDKTRR